MGKKLGRPKKPSADRLQETIHIRLTRDDYRAVQAAAKLSGVSESEFARKALILATQKPTLGSVVDSLA